MHTSSFDTSVSARVTKYRWVILSVLWLTLLVS